MGCLAHLLLFFGLLSTVGPASAGPDAPAPWTGPIELAGHEVEVDVYLPVERSPLGVAIIAHGFTRSRARHRDLAQALAGSGIVAVVPDLPFVVDHHGNGEALVQLVGRVESGALGLPPTRRSHIVLIGTSAGGYASVLAAAELPGLAGWIGLDPVDRTGSAAEAASRLEAPAVVLRGKPSGCNLYGSARSIARAAPRLLRSAVVEGAGHCDFEGPTTKLCRVLCGESSAAAQARVREETTAAALEMLAGNVDRPPPPGRDTEAH